MSEKRRREKGGRGGGQKARGGEYLDHADRSKEKRFDFVVSVLQEPSGIEVGDDRDRRLKGLTGR
eukprot:571344-Hanusia_phi.AAC.2